MHSYASRSRFRLRNTLLARCALTLALTLPLAGAASAADNGYPNKPIRLVVGFPAGQSSDTIARLFAHVAAGMLGQSIFVDNRPGAAGIIAHEAVKNAAPDGYTLLLGSSATLAINPSLYANLRYRPDRDYEPIVLLTGSPLYLFTGMSTPVRNLKEMVAYVKANPGKISYGSGGSGTTAHIAMELLKKQAGINMLHVPYKGSPAMITDVIGGQVQFGLEPAASILPLAKAGKVRLLAITSKRRSPAMPDVPTVDEQGLPGFEAIPWTGLLAPKGTPAPIIQALNVTFNQALKDPAIVAELGKNYSISYGGNPADFRQYIRMESQKWGQAVALSGAHID